MQNEMSVSQSHFHFLLFLISCNCLYHSPNIDPNIRLSLFLWLFISKVNRNTKLWHIAEPFQFRLGGHTTNSLNQHGLQVLDPFHHIPLTGLLSPILPTGEGDRQTEGIYGKQSLFWSHPSQGSDSSQVTKQSLHTAV